MELIKSTYITGMWGSIIYSDEHKPMLIYFDFLIVRLDKESVHNFFLTFNK